MRSKIKRVVEQQEEIQPNSKPKFNFAPQGPLERIVEAAAKDLATARLAEGLLECILGGSRRSQFRGEPAGLLEWCGFPKKLHSDVLTLVDWALSPAKHDVIALYRASMDIKSAVRKVRQNSQIAKHFRARAKRLTRLHPALPQTEWRTSGTTFDILPAEIGKPLSEGIIELAKSFRPQTLQILLQGDPLNSTWTVGVLTIRLDLDGYTVSDISMALETPKPTARNPLRRIEGTLVDFFETGTEGVIWMIEDDSRHGRDALEAICEGDYLTITDQMGVVIWRGTIRCDRETGLRPYPMNPKYSQQCALGLWIHWIQEGFKPDDWGRFFIRSENDRYRGILKKRGQKRIPYLGARSLD